MANLTILSGGINHLYLQNLKKHFLFVKGKVNELLEEDNNTSFSQNPIVGIEAIARNVGITKIQCVPPEEIDNEHARLKGTVILVKENDSPEEQRFSIAHEIYHFLKSAEKEMLEAARSDLKFEILKDRDRAANEDIQIFLARAYMEIGKLIYEYVGKPISERTKSIVFGKIGIIIFKIIDDNKNKNITLSDILTTMLTAINNEIIKAIDEEIADYFAANLIVPTERFILWEDKTDDEIARAFGVNVECIRKRRNEEIEHELVFMVPQNQASNVGIEEESPLSLDELELALEGYNNHDTGRV